MTVNDAVNYEIIITSRAERQIRKLEHTVRTRIVQAIDTLAVDPRRPGVEKLQGRDAHRLRVGDYRVVYTIGDAVRIVTVVQVAHRREVYR
ncbi:MAG: type II toxin-antitoxin system RelE/ParE family toxin [Chloroflexi bacterium]|nr:type II toxin-antitoxin system RelE/ParE family toxin [Chloroflexota bacterium]